MKLLIPILLALLTSISLASPTALVSSADGKLLYATIEEPASLAVVDPANGAVTARHMLPAAPTGMALAPDGKQLYITAGLAPGRLLTVDASSGKVLADTPAGHSPCAPVVSLDGSRVFVCNRFEDEVIVINPKGGAVVGKFPVLREPNAAVLRKDGAALFVTNHLPAGAANTGDIGCALSVIDVDSGATRHVRLPNGSTGVEGIGISPDGGHVYLTHTLARYGLPTTQVDRGWMNTSAVSVIDTKEFKLRASVLLDNIDLGAANPWGVACSPDGSLLFVAHAGTHELSVIDRAAMHERIARAEKGEKVTEVSDSAADIANDLSFLVGIRERRKLTGKGPRAITVLGGRQCAVGAYFSGTLHLVTTESLHGRIRDIELAPPDPADIVKRGESFFHDGTRCFQHWQSCATCHPGNARTDALNWDLLNDGIGNPKQAKSMLKSMDTPPAMITGIRADAPTAIRAGMRYIHFAQVMEEDAEAVEAYLSALKPIPSPALVNGKLSESAQRGKAVFEKANCALCHSGPDYTDKQMYEVGTGTGRERGIQLDTPTLVEVWRTAPYLHDGRAPDLKTLFTEHNPKNDHGHTSNLSEQEMDDLVEYLRSL
jgi:DNA-binding beta-propeller fold protein YncE/mono/diheme cytochrome c family protein